MLDLKNLEAGDPLKRTVEKESGHKECSPMDPPEAYEPPAKESISYEAMHPYLQSLINEHKKFTEALQTFEEALIQLREKGLTPQIQFQIRDFFQFFDQDIHSHGKKEEKELFPLLRQKLIKKGEHGQGTEQKTGVDILEEDHTQALQLAAVSFNLFGLTPRISDPKSRLEVLDLALSQSLALIELLRLHIFRENEVIFPLAQKYLTQEEWSKDVRNSY